MSNSTIEQAGRPEYGGLGNLQCIADLKTAYRKHNGMQPNLMFEHCIEMVLVKLARIMTGEWRDDNITDAIGYLTLARQVREADRLSQERAKYHEAR